MSNIPTQSDAVVRPMASSSIPEQSAAQRLDATDRRIVEALSKDGRMSMRALAETLHISRANAYARVERLLSSGVIRGFRAEIDPNTVGLATSAFVTINLHQGDWREVSSRLRAVPGIAQIALVGGEFDVIVLVRARDNSDLRRIVLDEIHGIPGVVSTHTLLVFEESTTVQEWAA